MSRHTVIQVRDYRPDCYFFEIVEFARKLGLTGLLLVARRGTTTQVLLGLFVSFMFAGAYIYIQPYIDARANAVRMVADASMIFTLVCVLVMHHPDNFVGCEFLSAEGVGYFLVVINVVFV